MERTKFDLAVIDYSADGTDDTAYSAKQIRHLKNGAGGQKIVLSYLSIGEAEDYRWYWRRRWDAGHDGMPDVGKAPRWLGPVDPDWAGNYKVKFWDPRWQNIVLQYVDKVMAAGFDGVYLDIIDAYEFWEPGGPSGLNRKTAEQEMVDFVKSIAAHARQARPDFLVFVQNAEELGRHADYVQAVSGIGREDTWYDGDRANKASDVREVLGGLDRFKKAGKLVLCIDYVTKARTIDDFYAKAEAKGYVPYASDRDLDRLTINKGHEP
jgi:cysteinyl-tRNA synthetase